MGTHFQQVEAQSGNFWELLVLVMGIAEVFRATFGWNPPIGDKANVLRDDYFPGNLKFDPFGFFPADQDEMLNMRNKELSNGRLAMIGISGMIARELVDGQKIFEHIQNAHVNHP